jgi:hypothetical protein
MSIPEALSQASAKPAGKRPYFLEPQVERVLAITMAVVQELAVTRQRLDTVERLMAAQGVVSREAIDTFSPTPDEAAERGLWVQEYLSRVLRIIQQEAEAAQAQGDVASEDVAVELRD